jgi:hypothetical protein
VPCASHTAAASASSATTTPGVISPSGPTGSRACDQAVSIGSAIGIESMLTR